MSLGALASYLVERNERVGDQDAPPFLTLTQEVTIPPLDSITQGPSTVSNSPEGSLNGIEVVGSDGDELPVSAEVGMQLVLEVNERLVAGSGERLLEPEDSSSEEGPDLGHRGGEADRDELVGGGRREGVVGRELEVEEDSESESETLDAEEIVSGADERRIRVS